MLIDRRRVSTFNLKLQLRVHCDIPLNKESGLLKRTNVVVDASPLIDHNAEQSRPKQRLSAVSRVESQGDSLSACTFFYMQQN